MKLGMLRCGILVGVILVALTGCELPYTSSYNAIAAAADARMAQRQVREDLQLGVIAKKIRACMVEPNGAFDGSGAVGKVTDRLMGSGERISSAQANAGAEAAEQLCTDDLIEEKATADPKGAIILTKLLIEQHYAVSSNYSAEIPSALPVVAMSPHAEPPVAFSCSSGCRKSKEK